MANSINNGQGVTAQVRNRRKAIGTIGILLASFLALILLAGSGTAAAPNTVALTKMDMRALERFTNSSLTGASLLKTLSGRSYYRITNAQGPDCYGVGPTEPGLYRLGQVQCTPDFPSAERPVLDFTILRGGSDGGAKVVRSEGFAADGIADLVFQTLTGGIVGVMPVKDNVYSLTTALTGPVERLAARDLSGTFVWSESLVQAAAER